MARSLTIDRRFCGPPDSGNGGYVSGRLAGLLGETGPVGGAPVQVTLRRPPPLDTPMRVEPTDDGIVAMDGSAIVAEAAIGALTEAPVAAVPTSTAVAAAPLYAGLRDHPFPGCFVCGTARTDGMSMRPGQFAPGRTAALWTVTDAGPEFVWCALDCPGGWTSDLGGRPLVLGRMTASVSKVPARGDRVVVVGELLAVDGRKTRAATAAYDADGVLVGRAEQIWFAVSAQS